MDRFISINGYQFKISEEDVKWIQLYDWRTTKSNSRHVYAVRRELGLDGIIRVKYMHREILGEEPKRLVYADHKNGDTLDNRRENLRWATPQQSRFNSSVRYNNKLGVKGVHVFGKKYRAMICHNGKRMHLGLFETIEEAKVAYDSMAKQLFGDFSRS